VRLIESDWDPLMIRVLYQARIHPSCPTPALSDQNLKDLHHQLRAVPLKAVEVNADSHQFPEDWLFRWRWSKGKKQAKGSKKSKKVEEEEGSADELKPAGKDFLALVSLGPKIA
jgi:formamidopyrimidine-DNA glycosylase